MKSKALFLLLLLTPFIVSGRTPKNCKTIKVAVIDTGLDLTDPRFINHLCKTGHKNFVDNETLDDINYHGTHVAGLIEKYAGNANYCLLIYKYFSDNASGLLNLSREVLALQEAIKNGADIINFSGGGDEFSEEEALLIKYHPEITFVVAAGNDHHSLDIPGNEFYPASLFLPNEEVVAAVDKNKKLIPETNYGKYVENKELGFHVLSLFPNGQMGYMTGSSQATAIFSGKLVAKTSRMCKSK
jgi:subtilisin family serine protease